MLAAATAGGVRRFVHVSSLAAREPKLSLYGASKARAEELVNSSGLDWAIVRPPAVYGPGDSETLELFRMAKLGLMLMPPKGRVSVIHAHDLARLLIALAAYDAPSNILIEPDDGKPGGWTHRQFARALGQAVGTRPAIVSSPGVPPPPRRASRPDASPKQGQADPRPRRLFLAPQLGRRAEARLPAGCLAARNRHRPGAEGNGRLVPRRRLALEVTRGQKRAIANIRREAGLSPLQNG